MIVLVMGVAGSGKTTVGQAVATALGAVFLDADAFHSDANIAKMSRGEPLTDADRQPWLKAMNRVLREHERAGQDVVLACSALKKQYRDILKQGLRQTMQVVYLQVDRAMLEARMKGRTDHFMPAALLDSQLAALEEPQEAMVIDATRPLQEVVEAVIQCLRSK